MIYLFELPKLPFSYEELEPFIDTHTNALHYHKHTQTYLNNLNNLLLKNNYQGHYSLTELLFHLEEFKEDKENILFNLGGVINHNLYFQCIKGKDLNLTNNFKEKFINEFKNFDNFWEELTNKALTLKGSGYIFLVINQKQKLELINLPNQETPLLHGYIPLLCIDLWEHAYYLNYENDKAKYLANIKNIINLNYANNTFNNYQKYKDFH